jgi:intracellular sulfur oxidation DsrE/DsrF family protein
LRSLAWCVASTIYIQGIRRRGYADRECASRRIELSPLPDARHCLFARLESFHLVTIMNEISRRDFAALGAAGLLAAAVPAAQSAAAESAGAGGVKAVMQVSDNDYNKWTLALGNAHNAQAELGAANVELEIVVYGPGIGMLKSDSPVDKRVADALKAGVRIVACQNTMKHSKLVPADMLPDIGYVPAGVVELMLKQQQGYAYIRP